MIGRIERSWLQEEPHSSAHTWWTHWWSAARQSRWWITSAAEGPRIFWDMSIVAAPL